MTWANPGSPFAQLRPGEMKLAAVVLDDQVVPLVVWRTAAREAQRAVERPRGVEVGAREQGQGAEHWRTLDAPPPPLEDELEALLDDPPLVIAVPDGATSHHLAPKPLLP